jgi:hypothetical protein
VSSYAAPRGPGFRILFCGNLPVALFTAAATFVGLFGLGSSHDFERVLWIFSPVLLAAILAVATKLYDGGAQRAGLALMATPILGLLVLIIAAVSSA